MSQTGGQNQSVFKNAEQDINKAAKGLNKAANELLDEGEKVAKDVNKAAKEVIDDGEKVARDINQAANEAVEEGQRLVEETERLGEEIEEDVTGERRESGGSNQRPSQEGFGPSEGPGEEQDNVQPEGGESSADSYEDRFRNYFRRPCIKREEIPEIEIPECPPEIVKALTLWQRIKRFIKLLFGWKVDDEKHEPLPPPPVPPPPLPPGEPMDPYGPYATRPPCFPAMEYRPRLHEDRLDWYWARCWNDFLVKVSCGLAMGLVARRLLSCRKAWWPFTLTTGAAVGLAYQNCEYELNEMLTTCSKAAKKEDEKQKEDETEPV